MIIILRDFSLSLLLVCGRGIEHSLRMLLKDAVIKI